MHGFLETIGVAFLAATVLGLAAHRLRQPVVLGYLVAGIVVGPRIGPPLLDDPEAIDLISELGLILLLFIIGLEMDLGRLARAGRQMLVAGVGQFLLCAGLGYAALGAVGPWSGRDALYVALVVGMSSTAIVVKILHDRREIDTLHGRLTIGILVFQDIWAVLLLGMLPSLDSPGIGVAGTALAKCVLLVGGAFAASRYVLSRIFPPLARTPELVVVTSLGWCAAVAGAAGALDLSKEMGALIAGMAVSAFPYHVYVASKVLSLRDFFLTLFFVSIGMKIPPPTAPILAAALGLVVLVYGSRFATVYPLLAATGASRRTAFLASLNLSQLGEFAIVIASIGLALGHIEERTMSVLTYTLAITAVLSSYLMPWSHALLRGFDAALRRVGLQEKGRAGAGGEADGEARPHPIVILGYHRGGRALVEALRAREPDLVGEILVVDYNLETLKEVRAQGMAGLYGDVSHMDILEHAGVGRARVVLSLISDMLLRGTTNAGIVRMVRSLNPDAYLVVTGVSARQAEELTALGASEVLLPYAFMGEHLAETIPQRLE